MIQQESRLRVADNSGATASRLRLAQMASLFSRSAEPNGLLGAVGEEVEVP